MNKHETPRSGERREAPVVTSGERSTSAARLRFLHTGAQVSAIGLFFIALIAALSLARPVLLPAVSAFAVTMMLGPLQARAERYGIPVIVHAIALWLLTVLVFYGVILLLAAPAVDWAGKAPEIGRIIQEKLHVLDRPINALNEMRQAFLGDTGKGGLGVDIVAFVQPVMSIVAPGIGQMMVFFGTLFFMLLARSDLRRMLVAFFEGRTARLRTLKILNDIESSLTGYLSMVTIINLVVGVAGGVVAWIAGLPDPIAWGVLGFILNYVPYIGALMMEVALFVVGLVTFPTLTQALVAPLLYLGFTTLEGHFITPSLVGRKLTLNPLAVFLALVFWTWLWGPVGAFLAVPLLIMGLVAVSHLFPRSAPDLPD